MCIRDSSYPLGGKYHIAHGVSNAILFAHVMEFNKDACSKRLAILCDAVYPELAGKSEDEKAQYMIDQIADIVKVTNIPTDLKEFGVKPVSYTHLLVFIFKHPYKKINEEQMQQGNLINFCM